MKSDFFKLKTTKTEDKIRRFGAVMTPYQEKICQIMQMTAFQATVTVRVTFLICR